MLFCSSCSCTFFFVLFLDKIFLMFVSRISVVSKLHVTWLWNGQLLFSDLFFYGLTLPDKTKVLDKLHQDVS